MVVLPTTSKWIGELWKCLQRCTRGEQCKVLPDCADQQDLNLAITAGAGIVHRGAVYAGWTPPYWALSGDLAYENRHVAFCFVWSKRLAPGADEGWTVTVL